MDFVLREWKHSDLDSLGRHANNINIAKFLAAAFPHPYTIEAGKQHFSLVLDVNPTKNFAIEVEGEAVGSIGIFSQSDIHNKNAEMGYWLSEQYWGLCI